MNTYTVTSASGKTFTRTSKKVYSHAVIITTGNGVQVVKFAGSADLAQKIKGVVIPRCARGEFLADLEAKAALCSYEIFDLTSN
jgi:hypothetical protein